MANQTKDIFKPDGKNSIHDGTEHGIGEAKALIDPTAGMKHNIIKFRSLDS